MARSPWVLCMQSFPAFLQEAVSMTFTHGAMTSWSQGNNFTDASGLPSLYEFIAFLKFKLCALIMVLNCKYAISYFSNF
jgi:hypothetical protein